MANKFVALLLLVSLVAAVQGDDEYVTPEECYNYCFHAMLMPAPVADTICRWRCKFPMWAAASKAVNGNARKNGPIGSPVPAPKMKEETQKIIKD
ncbi:hypothetical protein P8452_45258 [Trifolium repens]|nr:hypothetical protein QL285_073010 [Trifolium repens]WJX60004.1 hypothetical protein P8452_45258 [Trifolium repens]